MRRVRICRRRGAGVEPPARGRTSPCGIGSVQPFVPDLDPCLAAARINDLCARAQASRNDSLSAAGTPTVRDEAPKSAPRTVSDRGVVAVRDAVDQRVGGGLGARRKPFAPAPSTPRRGTGQRHAAKATRQRSRGSCLVLHAVAPLAANDRRHGLCRTRLRGSASCLRSAGTFAPAFAAAGFALATPAFAPPPGRGRRSPGSAFGRCAAALWLAAPRSTCRFASDGRPRPSARCPSRPAAPAGARRRGRHPAPSAARRRDRLPGLLAGCVTIDRPGLLAGRLRDRRRRPLRQRVTPGSCIRLRRALPPPRSCITCLLLPARFTVRVARGILAAVCLAVAHLVLLLQLLARRVATAIRRVAAMPRVVVPGGAVWCSRRCAC